MRLNYHVQAPPWPAPLQCAPLPSRDEASVQRVAWPMVVTQWSHGVRQPSGSRCVVVSGHYHWAQPGLCVDLATTVYLIVDGCPVYWFAFVLLADIFDIVCPCSFGSALLTYLEAFWNCIRGRGILG